MAGYRYEKSESLRVLFCFGVSQCFFEEETARLPEILEPLTKAFEDLEGRFGVKVLGTLDDDQTMVGPSAEWPWTAYILADAPSYDAVVQVCNLLRDTSVGAHRLWRYMRVEARVGRRLFFGNE